jgi:RNA polymerase sigma-70 factor (ECF subfamily)
MAAVSPLGRASGVEPRTASADALTGLYDRHADRIFQYCLNWMRSREEAEDAAQTTFLYAYRGLDRGVVPTHERGWLLSIARNVCLSRTEAARRRAVEVAQDPHALEEIIAAPAPSIELEGLTDALAALTEQQRHAILLREWHGLSYSEIAERLELSQAAVETLLFRARRSLARRLRRPVGIGSFLPWLRSLGEGGAAKVALGAAAIAITATSGAVTITHQHQPRQAVPTVAMRSAPTPRAIAVARRAKVAPAKHPAASANVTSAPTTVGTPRTKRQPQHPAATPTHPRADSPGISAPAIPPPLEPVAAAQTVADTAATATGTVAAPVVDTVTSAVSNTTDTVVNAATDVVATAQATIAAVTSVVPAITGPKLP